LRKAIIVILISIFSIICSKNPNYFAISKYTHSVIIETLNLLREGLINPESLRSSGFLELSVFEIDRLKMLKLQKALHFSNALGA